MGIDYSCQTVESEEEAVNKIYNEMFKKEFKQERLYDNFLKCITYGENEIKLNHSLFYKFLDLILVDNCYMPIYKEYFNSIIAKNNKNDLDKIKKIGLILIENGIGKDNSNKKVKYYTEHFTKFYLQLWKENQNQLITKIENQEFDFNNNINKEESDKILKKTNLFNDKENSDDSYRAIMKKVLETNRQIPNMNLKNTENKKDPCLNNNGEFNMDLEKINMNDINFFNFLKKSQLEMIETQIKNLILDLIDNNTHSLLKSLETVMNKKRLDNLVKSWNLNVKKLLLFDIQRNYTRLVEKNFLYTSIDASQNFKSKRNLSYETSSCLVNKRMGENYNSVQNKNFKNSLNIDDLDENKALSSEESVKTLMKKELEKFNQMKQKLIFNFFELSDTQLNGDTIRNWLYDNSRNN